MTGFEAAARRALDLLGSGALDPAHVLPVAALGLLEEEDLDRPLRQLSVGQRRRFELAAALVAAPHVLVLDEPTNHLSIALVDELTEALRLTSAAVVVATHDRAMRADLADWPAIEL
jgi:macrolide transport system ATP-binding/permease protein